MSDEMVTFNNPSYAEWLRVRESERARGMQALSEEELAQLARDQALMSANAQRSPEYYRGMQNAYPYPTQVVHEDTESKPRRNVLLEPHPLAIIPILLVLGLLFLYAWMVSP